jgi:hypothetical protein
VAQDGYAATDDVYDKVDVSKRRESNQNRVGRRVGRMFGHAAHIRWPNRCVDTNRRRRDGKRASRRCRTSQGNAVGKHPHKALRVVQHRHKRAKLAISGSKISPRRFRGKIDLKLESGTYGPDCRERWDDTSASMTDNKDIVEARLVPVGSTDDRVLTE